MKLWTEVARYLGVTITEAQLSTLQRYLVWLEQEAIPAGGLGPGEAPRLQDRHIADSLLFYDGWSQPMPPRDLWDLGSGVGLPGIPLAVLLPESRVTLVDRAARRVDLAKRVCRVLDLTNVSVRQSAISDLRGEVDMIVSRASMSPENLTPVMRRHLRSGGRAVVGGSWVSSPIAPAGWQVREIPTQLLDHHVWLLIMAV